MRSSSESETEILLGNKHLLGIFFVIAILLGVAFTGGYMVGRNSAEKRPATVSAGTPDAAATPTNPSSLETHSVPPPAGSTAEPSSGGSPGTTSSSRKTNSHVAEAAPQQDAPLGSTKRKPAAAPAAESEPGERLSAAVRPNLSTGRGSGTQRSRWNCRCAEQERISRTFGG